MKLPLDVKSRAWLAPVIACLVFAPTTASAEERVGVPEDSSSQPSAASEAPIVAYTYTAHGASTGAFGAQAYGSGLTGNKRPTLGGGATVWGAPVQRLTLVGDFSRDVFGNFAPSAAGVVRIFGRADEGLSLGGLGKFKVDGFGVGPNDEIESELEAGLLLSYTHAGWHLDMNAITGFGLGDDGEIDSEARLRFGYDVTEHVRLGLDGQARYRLQGTYRLPGHRLGDFAVGPQTVVGTRHFYGAFTAGPTSMGITDGDRAFGWTAVLSIGGSS
jgi:hypothetical protein